MKYEGKKANKGITLIALVITIIVLLILAGISIATLTGENGVLTKANTAKEESKKAEYKETLQLIGNGLRSDKIMNQWDSKRYLDEFEKEIQKDEKFKEASIRRKNNETIIIVTKEGFVFIVTEDEIKFTGIYDEKNLPELQSSDIIFNPSTTNPTNRDVKVTITTTIQAQEYELEYSTDGISWKVYKESIIMTENGWIYARLVDIKGNSIITASKEIKNIDKVAPSGKIQVSQNNIDILTKITISYTLYDEQSGMYQGASGRYLWISPYSDASGVLEGKLDSWVVKPASGKVESIYITKPGTWYFHLSFDDIAGNKAEIISEPITVTGIELEPSIRIKGYKIEVKAELPQNEAGITVKTLSIDNIGSYNGNEYIFDVKKQGIYTVKTTLSNQAVIETIVEVPYYEETDVFAYVNDNNIAHSDFFTLSNHYGDNEAYIARYDWSWKFEWCRSSFI